MSKRSDSLNEELESADRSISDYFHRYFYFAALGVTVSLYVHSTFATNARVSEIEKKVDKQQKISCLIALKLNVPQKDLKDMCHLNL